MQSDRLKIIQNTGKDMEEHSPFTVFQVGSKSVSCSKLVKQSLDSSKQTNSDIKS